MKILIMGGFGFVGGRLGMHLSTSNHEVYLGSRSFRQRPRWLKQGGVVQVDWNDKCNLDRACKYMDVVIQAAGMNASDCSKDPDMAMEVNGVATKRLVKSAQNNAVSKFIYISSAHVYSNNLSGVITEDNELLNSHPYASSHVAGEVATINGHLSGSIHTIVVRLANAFGTPMDQSVNCWHLVVNDLCKQAAIDRRMVIRGPSNTTRNFITMTDTCLGLEFLINDSQAYMSSTICNLGDMTKTIFNIASNIRKLYADKMQLKLQIVNLSNDSSFSNRLDFQSRVLNKQGYFATSNFNSELSSLIEFCELNFREGK